MTEPSGARLVGIVLLLVVPLLLVDGVSSTRAGYTAAFWAGTRDRKLDHIVEHRRGWVWMGVLWILVLAAVTSGLTAFTGLLARVGEEVVAGVALGSFLLGAFGWMVGMFLQIGPADIAARQRKESGTTPGWLEPMWSAAGWAEISYIALTSLAYVAWGVGMVNADFPATWTGWASIGLGGVSLIGVLAAPSILAIPQIPLLVPIVLGVALVIS